MKRKTYLLPVYSVIFIFILSVFNTALYGQQQEDTYILRGVVKEAGTEMPLTSVYIRLTGTEFFAISGLDGSFTLSRIPRGKYEINLTYLGFTAVTKDITVNQDQRLVFTMTQDSKVIGNVSVSGKRDLTTDGTARADEKKADNVINIISARSIELSPDLTVANITQRVSGVSLERNNNGDGQHAIVRGMDKRYNYTLVNGIKIPSPDAKNRYVPLDIFPSDLLDRLVVSKSLLPNMEGDAIGGVIDMKMKDAPDRLTLNVNLGTGYNMLYNQRDFTTFDRSTINTRSPHASNPDGYRATVNDFPKENMSLERVSNPINQLYSLSVGNRFFQNKVGVIVAGSYQNTYRGANSMFMETFVSQENNTPYFQRMQDRKFSVQQVRSGLHAKMDLKINSRNKIDLYLASVDLRNREVRDRIDTILSIGRGQGPGTGRIELRERTRQTNQKIYNSTLQGTHYVSRLLKLDWSGVYSLATNDDPDMLQLQWETSVTKNPQTGALQYEPRIYSRDFSRRWQNNTDNDLAAYVNTTYSENFDGTKVEVSAGGMYRHKNRNSAFNSYLFRTSPINQVWSGDVNDYQFNLFNNIGTPTDPLNYNSLENILALYAMFKLHINNIQVMGGVRNESTYFEWETSAPPQVQGRTGSISYTDLLPSLHLKWMVDNKTNVRASYFASISRPNFFEVIPYDINEEDFRERGNPFLDRTKADNIDMRIERFPTPLDQIMVGVFFKRIQNPIETALFIQGQTVFLQPNNFGTATNYGIEFDYTKYVKRFGIRAFYTFTQSEITTSKIVRFRDNAGTLSSREEFQTRPLQGQSRHISNVALLFKDPKIGLDMQVAMVYTGDRIISVSPYLDNDIWQRGFVQLDFSAEKTFKKKFAAYVKVNNILNTPLLADIRLPNTFNPEQAPYLDSRERVLVREDFYWQTIVVGLKYKL